MKKVKVEEKLDASESKVVVSVIAKPGIQVSSFDVKTSEKAGKNQFAIFAKTNGRDSITNARQPDWDQYELRPPCDLLDGFTSDKASSPEDYMSIIIRHG